MKHFVIIIFLFLSVFSYGQIERIEPPNWWIGFENAELQLLVYGKEVGKAQVGIDYPGVEIEKIHQAKSKNYLFIDLNISAAAKPGIMKISFTDDNKKKEIKEYELKVRTKKAEEFIGFDNSDVLYLITPDRFANADTSNDTFPDLKEKTIDLSNDYARHGGDIKGITAHLDYIDEMGFTAIWPSPLLLNDMPEASYHGYAITDFYQVDPRFGTLEEYKNLADEARKKGLKLLMDQVVNHTGIEHWWMKDLPFGDWINFQERYENGEKPTFSNHRRTVNQDVYASAADKKVLSDGWFVESMPDLNQRNPFMAHYLIQNSIWWIETLGLGGIRQDTYPYPDKQFMSHWAGAIMTEYPNFNIVGEEWSNNPLLIAYWQDGKQNAEGYDSNLRSTMDFAMQSNIVQALNEDESWDKGLIKMYDGLANDFAYASPENIMIFPDNHDMSRIYTQLGEDLTATKMALGYMLVLPRIPQIYYGTEILMNDTAKPGDHGLIRTNFPGGWKGDEINAFKAEGLTEGQLEMQNFLKTVLNYRKDSEAIKSGKTIHFAAQDGVYLLSRISADEKLVVILNKNEEVFNLDLTRFEELGFTGMDFQNLMNKEKITWNTTLELPEKGVYLLSTKMNNQ
ncbi:glycoside hydrolase family 13 protein [Gramella sp. AN32]|uniref:Glycoside hydrolase family 13 protein n=1 Tax=Christiangramia antarctica TaxID=2058158 RepID=A0ABW5WZI8_9FLAO|nr:glycoside hydrolase family 13 protein [Gramella sp. AN32]MCM4155617.1 alpha-amlyase [Gramella sp. AN32]